MYHFTLTVAKLVVRLFGKVEVKNKHLLPENEGYIVTCTHRGWLEIVILGICVPKPIHFMAKKELFENKIIEWFLRKINAFPVDRENPSPSTIKQPVKLLKSREIVGIFPSGTRTAEDVPLKRGAVTIGNLSSAPIVPELYVGSRTLIELRKMKKATILFGKLIYVKTNSKEGLATFTELLNKKTLELESQIER
ncbi:lysophospholipid acyltransferase family protein [Psychrobacillus sp. L3]|uniref:lysophospholipid acyltransferase family protein n=1 Tax=Psychrobacillus sp. L3 TaxID=3236891 RepID=UPI0036F3FD5B